MEGTSTLKYGKLPATEDHRDLLLKDYLGTIEPPPADFGHAHLFDDWGMLGNDRYGDCVWAGSAHEDMIMSKGLHIFSDEAVLSDYSRATGFDPSEPNTDRGTVVRDAMRYRHNQGIIDASNKRHKIGAYVRLTDLDDVTFAAYYFEACGIGFKVPAYAEEQFPDEPWSVEKANDKIVGGHYVPVVGRSSAYLQVITWGQVQLMTVPFYDAYCDEAWTYISHEMVNGEQDSPEGFDIATLRSDLAQLGKRD